MPIPFLIGAAALAVGGLGVAGGLAAKETMDQAKELGKKGERLVENAKRRCDSAKEDAEKTIEELGNTKAYILSNNMNDFAAEYRKLENLDYDEYIEFEKLRDFTPQSNRFKTLAQASFTALDLSKGYGGGLAGGGLTALGAYGAVGLLGTASTGTAIGTLGGAAATNATLAWLGGGSLATGGLGIAGGTAVLGGIVAAPALLVGAFFLNCKAEEAMNKAKTYYAKAEVEAEKFNSARSLYLAIDERAEDIIGVLVRLDELFGDEVVKMQEVISLKGTNVRKFTRAERAYIADTASTALTLCTIIDTPLCREDGTLDPNSAHVFSLPGVRG